MNKVLQVLKTFCIERSFEYIDINSKFISTFIVINSNSKFIDSYDERFLVSKLRLLAVFFVIKDDQQISLMGTGIDVQQMFDAVDKFVAEVMSDVNGYINIFENRIDWWN